MAGLLTGTTLQAQRDAHDLYAQFCVACHGPGLTGGKAGSLIDDEWRFGGEDEDLARIIRSGETTVGMPAFASSLSDGEVRALVILIRETARNAVSPLAQHALPLPEGRQPSEVHDYRLEIVAEPLDVPWSLAFLPGDRLLISERVGRLRTVERGRLLPEEIAGVPKVWVRDEGGLMAIAADPDFARTGWIYLSFSDPGAGETAMTKIVRGQLRGRRLANQQTLFALPRETYPESGMGFGSRLLFHEGYLYFSIGDRGTPAHAQDLRRPEGKIHRVYPDGSVPPDNPLVAMPEACASIWSFGHRNPQGLAVNPLDGALWATEHGPRGGDELNRIHPGRNYGWPTVTHGMNYDGTPISAETSRPGMEPPVLYWTPSLAVSPLHFYTGDRFPGWQGHLFMGSLGQQELWRFVIADDRVVHRELIFKNLGRIRDIATGPDGLLYVALENPGAPGRVVRLVPEKVSTD